MRSSRSTFRPNAIPAKQYTVGQRVLDIKSGQKFTKNMKLRACVADLCDTCHHVIYIYRRMMTLRLRGYKFICHYCLGLQGGLKSPGGHVDYDFLSKGKLILGYSTIGWIKRDESLENKNPVGIDSSMVTKKFII